MPGREPSPRHPAHAFGDELAGRTAEPGWQVPQLAADPATADCRLPTAGTAAGGVLRHTMPDFADELAGRRSDEELERARDRDEARRALWWLTLFVAAAALTLWLGWPPGASGATTADCPTADCRAAAGDAPQKDQARLAPVAVRIIDGDTFELAGETIRIADIDTPELAGACDAEKALARLAAARLAELLATHPWSIRREFSNKDLKTKSGKLRRDRYGRTLAVLVTVAADGAPISIGAILVAEGYAAPWEGRRHEWCGWQPRRGR